MSPLPRAVKSAALPLAAREARSQADFAHSIVPTPFPVASDTPIPSVNRGRLLEAYIALNLADWQLSYGNQSIWWGSDEGGAMMISDNAQPLRMFRVNRITPLSCPVFLECLAQCAWNFLLASTRVMNLCSRRKALQDSMASRSIRNRSFTEKESALNQLAIWKLVCREPRITVGLDIR